MVGYSVIVIIIIIIITHFIQTEWSSKLNTALNDILKNF